MMSKEAAVLYHYQTRLKLALVDRRQYTTNTATTTRKTPACDADVPSARAFILRPVYAREYGNKFEGFSLQEQTKQQLLRVKQQHKELL